MKGGKRGIRWNEGREGEIRRRNEGRERRNKME